MNVRIRLFAVARQLAERDSISLELAEQCTVRQLRERLAVAVPALAPILPHVLFAMGSEYVRDDHVLTADSELACIPPVSGG